jgi:hypothetical protein
MVRYDFAYRHKIWKQRKKKVNWAIFDYKRALKSKVWGIEVDVDIIHLEIMKEYHITYDELMNTPLDIYMLMKAKRQAENTK